MRRSTCPRIYGALALQHKWLICRAVLCAAAQLLLGSIDIDASGTIDYEEFLAATVNLSQLEKEENMYRAFAHFDTDNSGYITEDELEAALRVRRPCSRLRMSSSTEPCARMCSSNLVLV